MRMSPHHAPSSAPAPIRRTSDQSVSQKVGHNAPVATPIAVQASSATSGARGSGFPSVSIVPTYPRMLVRGIAVSS